MWWGSRGRDGPWPAPRWRTSAATNFPFKEQVVHEAYLARLYEEARGNGSLDDPLVADALAQAYIDLNVLRLHNLRTLTRLGAR